MKQRSAGVVWGIKAMGAPLFRFLSDIFLNNNSGHGVTWTGRCLLTEQSIRATHFFEMLNVTCGRRQLYGARGDRGTMIGG